LARFKTVGNCAASCNYQGKVDSRWETSSAVAFVGEAAPPSNVRRRRDQIWAHLALDPGSFGAAEGIDFNLTVSYYPGADIQLTKVQFRDKNATKTVAESAAAAPSSSTETTASSAPGLREVATIMDECRR
jgi:hypothetical protein